MNALGASILHTFQGKKKLSNVIACRSEMFQWVQRKRMNINLNYFCKIEIKLLQTEGSFIHFLLKNKKILLSYTLTSLPGIEPGTPSMLDQYFGTEPLHCTP